MKPYWVEVCFKGRRVGYAGIFDSSAAAIMDAIDRFFEAGARGFCARRLS